MKIITSSFARLYSFRRKVGHSLYMDFHLTHIAVCVYGIRFRYLYDQQNAFTCIVNQLGNTLCWLECDLLYLVVPFNIRNMCSIGSVVCCVKIVCKQSFAVRLKRLHRNLIFIWDCTTDPWRKTALSQLRLSSISIVLNSLNNPHPPSDFTDIYCLCSAFRNCVSCAGFVCAAQSLTKRVYSRHALVIRSWSDRRKTTAGVTQWSIMLDRPRTCLCKHSRQPTNIVRWLKRD